MLRRVKVENLLDLLLLKSVLFFFIVVILVVQFLVDLFAGLANGEVRLDLAVS